MGWHWEDFRVGQPVATPSRTVTEGDVLLFAGITGDQNELHTSATYAAERTPFGRPVAHGLLCLGIANGLIARAGLYEGTALALLGLEDWRFLAPVFPGDTLAALLVPVETRPSRSRPEAGIVRAELTLRNQNGVDVQKGVLALLVRRREAALP